jgi:hypothetical protein
MTWLAKEFKNFTTTLRHTKLFLKLKSLVVRGNEIVDRLAGKAAVNDILEMDKSDQQTATRQKLQLQETNEFKQSAYYKRFEELYITEGSGKILELFGKSRSIYNQNAIGITTTPTLREILLLGAEHIRGCPECNDATL